MRFAHHIFGEIRNAFYSTKDLDCQCVADVFLEVFSVDNSRTIFIVLWFPELPSFEVFFFVRPNSSYFGFEMWNVGNDDKMEHP